MVHGYSGSRAQGETIVVRANRARNFTNLPSDGRGGYLPETGSANATAQFVELDSVQAVPGIDLGWNEVINYAGLSQVTGGIEVYRSSGTLNQPIDIHDTYLQGAYPYNPAQDSYSGGGIVTDGLAGDNAQQASAFNSIHDNQVVGVANNGIEFAAGHDNVASNNRLVASGILSDGTILRTHGAGLLNAASPSASSYNNTMRDNLVGWACTSCASQGYRRDQYLPASPADYSTNTLLSGNITPERENNEYLIWMGKLANSGVAIGPSF